MKAVLLAAGMGTRLRPYTDSTPKCMVEVGGIPVIERTIANLVAQGIQEFAVNLHFRPEVIRSRLASGRHLGSSVRYYEESQLLGTAGALFQMKPWLCDDDFLVVYADNIVAVDIESLLRRHRSLSATATIALYWRDQVHASGVAELTPEGRVSAFIEKPKPGMTESHWINAGVLCCSPRILPYIPDGFSDFGHDVLPSLLRIGETVGGYHMADGERLYWIDTPEDFRNAEAAIAADAVSQ